MYLVAAEEKQKLPNVISPSWHFTDPQLIRHIPSRS
jgi:hypothetical protein